MIEDRAIVLVIDDQQPVLENIRKTMQGAHPQWRVLTYLTAAAALADRFLLAGEVNIAVCDWDLGTPPLDGLDLLIKMMRSQPSLYTVLITQQNLDLSAQALRWGVGEFIQKDKHGEWPAKLLQVVEAGIRKGVPEPKPTCFAMMPFVGWLNDVYRRIWVPAARTAGFRMVRNDEFPAGDLLVEEITEAIERASVAVADLTELRPNVLFEAGLARGKGKRLILLAPSPDVPSDLKGFHLVLYDRNGERWEERLEEELVRALSHIARRLERPLAPSI
jgi:DNA-binding response OmpR family regulator